MEIIKKYHVCIPGYEEAVFKSKEEAEAYMRQVQCWELFRKKFTYGGMNKDTFDIIYSFWGDIKQAMEDSIEEGK